MLSSSEWDLVFVDDFDFLISAGLAQVRAGFDVLHSALLGRAVLVVDPLLAAEGAAGGGHFEALSVSADTASIFFCSSSPGCPQ
jgi:hypothetical protein